MLKKSFLRSKILPSSLAVTMLLSMSLGTLPRETRAESLPTRSPLASIERTEKLPDTGFEENWSSTGSARYSTEIKSEGNRSGHLPANSNNAALFQSLELKPNTRYHFRAKVRFSVADAELYVAFKNSNLSSLNGTEVTLHADNSQLNQFKEYEGVLTSGSNPAVSFAFIKWVDANNRGPIWQSDMFIDEVSLEEEGVRPTAYEVVWKDEFDGPSLDLHTWEYELGSIRGIENQHYVDSPENVFVRPTSNGDGELVLKATNRPEHLQYNNPRNALRRVIYNSGSVRTHGAKEFLYGRIEMRAKLPWGKGVFPAFWTLGSDFTLDGDIDDKQGYGWANSGEIDIMELTGSANRNGGGNKTVYQTLHTGSDRDHTYRRFQGTSYSISQPFNDDYHIFGINWSKDKIEWYVDDQIVSTKIWSDSEKRTVNYKTVNRPQYIQLNLAMGGSWPGRAGTDLAGTEYAIDYVYYAQSEAQKRDAEEYYRNAPKLGPVQDLVLHQGETDVLTGVTAQRGLVDFSITDAPQFAQKETGNEGLTAVDLLVHGKNDLQALASLPVGHYKLYYTAYPEDIVFNSDGLVRATADKLYAFDRKAVNLEIVAPSPEQPEGVEARSGLVDLEQREKLTKGGFEEDWNATGTASYSTEIKTERNRSGHLPGGSNNAALYQVLDLKPHTKYRFRVKARFSNLNSFVNVTFKNENLSSRNGTGMQIHAEEASLNQFKEYTGEITVGDNPRVSFAFIKWTSEHSGDLYDADIYLDEASLEEVDAPHTDYTIVWKEDFDQDQLDTNTWEYELGSLRGHENQHYVNAPENVFLRKVGTEGDGELVLKATYRNEAMRFPNPRNNSRQVFYNSGAVRTHGGKEFLYGRIEMRAKLPAGKGVFPAFWTLGSDFIIAGHVSNKQGYGWADAGEIDIMELTGSANRNGAGNRTVYQTVHTGNERNHTYRKFQGTSYTSDQVFNDDYHIFGINWTKDKIEWYVDNHIVSTLDWNANGQKNSFNYLTVNRPQFLLLNLAMGGAWPGPAGENLAGTEYVIDYVYYAQSAQQKADADAYYRNAPRLANVKDLTITRGETNVIQEVTASNGTVDFSITDYPQFSAKEAAGTEANTRVRNVVRGKEDLESLANLPAGEYRIHYTALPEDIAYNEQGAVLASSNKLFKFDRRSANLTILPKRYTLLAEAGEHGSVSEAGNTQVNEGETKTYIFTPEAGYRVKGVYIDGLAQEEVGTSYTFDNVQADHSLRVEFEKKNLQVIYRSETGTASPEEETDTLEVAAIAMNDAMTAEEAEQALADYTLQITTLNEYPEEEARLFPKSSARKIIDVSLYLNGAKKETTPENTGLQMSYTLPEDLRSSAVDGSLQLIHVHKGVASTLPYTYEAESHRLRFMLTQFSTVAILKPLEDPEAGSGTDSPALPKPENPEKPVEPVSSKPTDTTIDHTIYGPVLLVPTEKEKPAITGLQKDKVPETEASNTADKNFYGLLFFALFCFVALPIYVKWLRKKLEQRAKRKP